MYIALTLTHLAITYLNSPRTYSRTGPTNSGVEEHHKLSHEDKKMIHMI